MKCDCGVEKTIPTTWLTYRNVKSCGCRRNDGHSHFKHGERGTRLYNIWKSMRERCNTETNSNYKKYGAKGIRVCKEWDDFSVFKKWADENGYRKDLTIDRIDVNGNYTPENCRWVTYSRQARNKRNTRYETFRGETKPLADLADENNISYSLLHSRLTKGWSIEEAILTPVGCKRKNA